MQFSSASGTSTLTGDSERPVECVTPSTRPPGRRPMLPPMKKLLVLIVVVALAAFAVKKLQDA